MYFAGKDGVLGALGRRPQGRRLFIEHFGISLVLVLEAVSLSSRDQTCRNHIDNTLHFGNQIGRHGGQAHAAPLARTIPFSLSDGCVLDTSIDPSGAWRPRIGRTGTMVRPVNCDMIGFNDHDNRALPPFFSGTTIMIDFLVDGVASGISRSRL